MTEPFKPTTMTYKPIDENCVQDVMCKKSLKVTYKITQKITDTLRFVHAVAVNGKVLAQYASAPETVWLAMGKSGEIPVPGLKRGDKVGLYIGSDACADWRKHLVYEVEVITTDVIVHITEVKGKAGDGAKDAKPEVDAKKLDPGTMHYNAVLNGRIWMRCSHVYLPSEVDARLPAGTLPQVAAAVHSLYEWMTPTSATSIPTLVVNVPAQGNKPARSVRLEFPPGEASNCTDNIAGFDLMLHGVPRVHPGGYAALINAALDNGVTRLRMTSCWRPLTGSIAHRVGLGLDVNYVGDVRLNRQELVQGKAPSADADANVSDEEKGLYRAWLVADREQKGAQKEFDRVKLVGTKEEKAAATARLGKAREAEVKTKNEWNKERDKYEPSKVKAFRESLYTCSCVRQLFDPWYMDSNAGDTVPATPNTQLSDNETTHAHHLHITVLDKKVMP